MIDIDLEKWRVKGPNDTHTIYMDGLPYARFKPEQLQVVWHKRQESGLSISGQRIADRLQGVAVSAAFLYWFSVCGKDELGYDFMENVYEVVKSGSSELLVAYGTIYQMQPDDAVFSVPCIYPHYPTSWGFTYRDIHDYGGGVDFAEMGPALVINDGRLPSDFVSAV